MFLFPPKLIPPVAAASAVLLAFPAWALAEYQLSATGSDRQAALGNLRVKALQQHLRTVLSPEDLKGSAGIIRKKIILQADQLTVTGEDLDFNERGGRTTVAGKVQVDDAAVMRILRAEPATAAAVGRSAPEQSPGGEATSAAVTSSPASSGGAESAMTAGPDPGAGASSRDPEKVMSGSAGTAVADLSPGAGTDTSAGSCPEGEPACHPAGTAPDPGKPADQEADNAFYSLVSRASAGEITEALRAGANPNARFQGQDGSLSRDTAFLRYADKTLSGRGDMFDPEVIRAFIQAGGDLLWSPDGTEYPVLAKLLSRCDEDSLLSFLELARPDLRKAPSVTRDGFSALGLYLSRHSTQNADPAKIVAMVRLLVSLGNEVNRIEGDSYQPKSLLKFAMMSRGSEQFRDISVMNALLDLGADPNFMPEPSSGKGHATPALFDAFEQRQWEHFQSLVSHGADPNAMEARRHRTLLCTMIRDDDYSTEDLRRILDAGADVNRASEQSGSETALMVAVLKQRPEVVEFLLKAGARTDSRTASGMTALFFATTGSGGEDAALELVRLLTEAGADPNAVAEGATPLTGAVLSGRPKVAEYLLGHGADMCKAVDVPIPRKNVSVYDYVMNAEIPAKMSEEKKQRQTEIRELIRKHCR